MLENSMENTVFFHYLIISLIIVFNAFAVAFGQALTSLKALKAFTIQPSAHQQISRTLILGMALIETSAVIGFAIATMLLFDPRMKQATTAYIHYSELGIGIAICLTGTVVGIGSSFASQAACLAIAR